MPLHANLGDRVRPCLERKEGRKEGGREGGREEGRKERGREGREGGRKKGRKEKIEENKIDLLTSRSFCWSGSCLEGACLQILLFTDL